MESIVLFCRDGRKHSSLFRSLGQHSMAVYSHLGRCPGSRPRQFIRASYSVEEQHLCQSHGARGILPLPRIPAMRRARFPRPCGPLAEYHVLGDPRLVASSVPSKSCSPSDCHGRSSHSAFRIGHLNFAQKAGHARAIRSPRPTHPTAGQQIFPDRRTLLIQGRTDPEAEFHGKTIDGTT